MPMELENKFSEEKEILKLRMKLIKFEHECCMEQFAERAKIDKIKHSNDLEEIRIKSAEIRRSRFRAWQFKEMKNEK